MSRSPQDAGCSDFRHALAAALRGTPSRSSLAPLTWHGHLVGCLACREFLEREEALEILLASLPEPVLPPDLAARVLSALKGAETHDPLERLLDLAVDRPLVPAGLADRVLAGVHATRADEALDRLLDMAGAVEVPADLGERVRMHVADELAGARRRRFQFLPGRPLTRLAAAAALLVGAAGLWQLMPAEDGVSLELLANLQLLDAISMDPTVLDALSVDPTTDIYLDLSLSND